MELDRQPKWPANINVMRNGGRNNEGGRCSKIHFTAVVIVPGKADRSVDHCQDRPHILLELMFA